MDRNSCDSHHHLCKEDTMGRRSTIGLPLHFCLLSQSPFPALLSAFQLLLPWCHRSSHHCQVGNLVTAGAGLRRGGSSSNTSTGLVPFTRPAELIALSSSEIDINTLELNEACWCRNKEAALMQLLLPRLHSFFEQNFGYQ